MKSGDQHRNRNEEETIMKRQYSRWIGYAATGHCYLEVYTDDDGASGYGDNAMVGRWWGTRAECEAYPSEDVTLRPLRFLPRVLPVLR